MDFLAIIFTAITVVCSMTAAIFWYRASIIKLSPVTEVSWDGDGPFADELAEISRLNAKGATFAALAAASLAFAETHKMTNGLY